jgi:tuberous sclerosis protein 2
MHQDPKFVSDQNLALVVRKMALHADMASKVYRSQKENANNPNLYGDKWYERLKQINRIKNMSKDILAKQQQQQLVRI